MKKILIVVDMQKDFVYGPLGSEAATAIVPKVVNKINEYKKINAPIFFTQDVHSPEEKDLTIEGKRFPEHCLVNTDGARLISEVSETMNDYPFYLKNYLTKFSFTWLNFVNSLASLEEELEVELVGVCTDICVISNALLIRSANPTAKVIVDASCCAGTSSENHEAALKVMKSCLIDVIGENNE